MQNGTSSMPITVTECYKNLFTNCLALLTVPLRELQYMATCSL